jgi:hypothetical protein
MPRFIAVRAFGVALASLFAAGCGGGGGGSAPTSSVADGGGGASTYSVGGAVSGLTGSGIVLLDNGGDHLSVPMSGPFTFATSLTAGATYRVSLMTQPANQSCVVVNGSGVLVRAAPSMPSPTAPTFTSRTMATRS